jgi:hypothetical protein
MSNMSSASYVSERQSKRETANKFVSAAAGGSGSRAAPTAAKFRTIVSENLGYRIIEPQ